MLTIEQICAELPALHAHMLELTTPALQAIRYTHAHTTGAQADSLPERATYARERLEGELAELQQIATILADTDHAEASIEQVAVVLAEHATTLAAWPDLLADLERIYVRWKTATAPDTETSNHLCPACGHAHLAWHHQERLYRCPACHYTGTAEHVANLRAHVITQADVWLSKRRTITLFNLNSESLRWHVRAGHLTPKNGLYHTRQLRDLPRRN